MREQTANKNQFPVLSPKTITELMHQVLGREKVELLRWHVQEITHITGAATDGVYRITGSGLDQGRDVGWSLILKVINQTPAGKAPAGSDEAHVLYWKREALVYQSGLLDDLPGGLRGPRCYAIMEQSDASLWLWLEDVKEPYGPRWPSQQFAQAAQGLGHMNGAYLAGRPLPAYPWLVSDGSPSGLLEHLGWMWNIVQDPATWQHPLLRSAFPIPVADRLLRLWEDRKVLLDVFERLPQTFCHLDAWRRNMFAPRTEDEPEQLVLIDWSYAGRGTIATDAGDLMGASFSMFGVEPCKPHALDAVIFENYLAGLSAAGWRGDLNVVRFAFATLTALKYGCVLFWLHQALDESQHASWERLAGHSIDECLHNQAVLTYYLLDLADEARNLIDSV